VVDRLSPAERRLFGILTVAILVTNTGILAVGWTGY
jgi:hypothetical protein